MAYLPVSVPLVQDYMSNFAAAKNDLFGGNYAAALASYMIDMAAPINAPVPADVSSQIYSASGDAQTTFLLWILTPRYASDMDSGCIVLLHSVFQFAIRLGRPKTK